MRIDEFQTWLAQFECLTERQREQARTMLDQRQRAAGETDTGGAPRARQSVGRRASARQLPRPDRQQTPHPAQGLPATVPRRRRKYLDSYPRWFQQVELSYQPSPRACLAAALSTPCIRFAN